MKLPFLLVLGVFAVGHSPSNAGGSNKTLPHYKIKDLGTLPGGNYSAARRINNFGQIAGMAGTSTGEIHPFLYSCGRMIDLGILPGHTNSIVLDMNDAGLIVGFAIRADGMGSSFLYSDGQMYDFRAFVETPPVIPWGLNNHGDVVGWAWPAENVLRAFVYSNRVFTILGTLTTNIFGAWSLASDINDRGEILGDAIAESQAGFFPHAVIFSNGQIFDLRTLPGGGQSSGSAINESGHVVGNAETPDLQTQHAFIYRDGMMTDLGALPGFPISNAHDVNNFDEVVGTCEDGAGNYRAFVYLEGAMYGLNELIRPKAGWDLASANGINDAGQIVGAGYVDGEIHAFLLTPVPKRNGNVRGVVENAVGGLAAEQTGLAVKENHNQTHQTHENKEHQPAGRSQPQILGTGRTGGVPPHAGPDLGNEARHRGGQRRVGPQDHAPVHGPGDPASLWHVG